jgi:hypothetical protein
MLNCLAIVTPAVLRLVRNQRYVRKVFVPGPWYRLDLGDALRRAIAVPSRHLHTTCRTLLGPPQGHRRASGCPEDNSPC